MNKMISVEVTTYCNFDCDYCYTKKYNSIHMNDVTFRQIIDSYKDSPSSVEFSLSGEGESMLHPDFWRYVDYIRQTTKHQASVITNGTPLSEANIQRAVDKLYRVRVSIDTMDPDVAESVGRHMHERVIENVKQLVKVHPRVTIMTVDFGQDIQPLREFIRTLDTKNPISHSITPVFAKRDYASTYTMVKPVIILPPKFVAVTCGFAQMKNNTAYNVDGVKMPCCRIKDISVYPGYDALVRQMSNRRNTEIPLCCEGCPHLSFDK